MVRSGLDWLYLVIVRLESWFHLIRLMGTQIDNTVVVHSCFLNVNLEHLALPASERSSPLGVCCKGRFVVLFMFVIVSSPRRKIGMTSS